MVITPRDPTTLVGAFIVIVLLFVLVHGVCQDCPVGCTEYECVVRSGGT